MLLTSSGKVSELLAGVPVPNMFYARQEFSRNAIARSEIPGEVERQLRQSAAADRIKPGMEIAITAGSRGIANVDIITRAIADFVKTCGANPFIVPAMGSHGGANAKGQLQVLEGYGITPDTMGCEIRSSMEVVQLGTSETGLPVYMDRNAQNSDGIIVSCRIKPHNAFRGTYESGPCKMMAIGLGKQKGAELVHSDGMEHIATHIPAIAKVMLEKAPVLGAVVCAENAYDETCHLEAVDAERIMQREPELLKFAFEHMARLIPGETDVLIVDQIGKNFSGTGVDPNITGTFSTKHVTGGIKVQRTCFLDLTDESHGNALGVGLASVITKRLFDKIDADMMYPNCLTSTVLASAYIPPVLPTDKEAIQACIQTCNSIDKSQVCIVRIPNSLHVGEIMLSEAYYDSVCSGDYPGLSALSAPRPLLFDGSGTLLTALPAAQL